MWVVDCYALFVAAAGPLPRAARVFIGNRADHPERSIARILSARIYVYFFKKNTL